MQFSLEARTASLSVGEFADFTIGPRDAGEGSQGLWRAQLGTHWHQQLRAQTSGERQDANFEVPINGRVFHRGWTLSLTGRIDQLLPGPVTVLREIKTVMRPLPAADEELRREYPGYFAQLATYLALHRIGDANTKISGELVFVEAGSGLAQTLGVTTDDESRFRTQLDRVVEFLDLRLSAHNRLRRLRFRPAFATLRPGQESVQADLATALQTHRAVFFEAPTGFGKTGALLEFALTQLRDGRFERVLYLTSKSTGQLQVVRQLEAMMTSAAVAPRSTPKASSDDSGGTAVAVWHVRNKQEHCVNHTFHCVRENCAYLADLEARWPKSGLARFYLRESEPHDLPILRDAGRNALICPYEITRAALAFNDVWIGDYNYVFAPGNRGLFFEQPGFDPARTLLIIDEAHNLPSRVADAYSHVALAGDAQAMLAELDALHAPRALVRAWENYAQLLASLEPTESLDPMTEADVGDALDHLAELIAASPLDYAALGPQLSELLWQSQPLAERLRDPLLKKLLWCPAPGELRFTCFDAADAIGKTVREFGATLFASATLSPADAYAKSVGLADGQQTALSETKSPTTAGPFAFVQAHTPWRTNAYNVAVDLRVDTTYQQRARFYLTTAETIETLQAAPSTAGVNNAAHRAIVVFFPSYRYAEAIRTTLENKGSFLRVALQPKLPDLAAQNAWVEESLLLADVIFLVLGSSFAEGIDLLGGRVDRAMVVGPALPEVNPVQRAKMEALRGATREAAFRQVYQIPGIQKVNQALGRLVRAPGQHARVILHCRRFAEPSYASLLYSEYQFGEDIENDEKLASWLGLGRIE